MRIFDCMLYNGEIEVLLLRLHELHEVVDFFVIAEATKTFSGKPKELYLRKQWKHVKQFARKIRYVVVQEDIEQGDAWDRERFQRNSIQRGLLDAANSDLVCLSDVDEIPRADVIRQMRSAAPRCVGFKLLMSYFFLNYRNIAGPESNLAWCCAFPMQALQQHTPNQLRHGIRNGSINAEHIDGAGWHFSYLVDLAGIKSKIEAFSHQEFNTPAFLDAINIPDTIRCRRDFFARPGFVWDVVGVNDMPTHVLSNPRRYHHLIVKPDGRSVSPTKLMLRSEVEQLESALLTLRSEVEQMESALQEAVCAAENSETERRKIEVEAYKAEFQLSCRLLEASQEKDVLMRLRSMRLRKPLRDLVNAVRRLRGDARESVQMRSNVLSLVSRWYSEDCPQVSIVILNLNKAHLTIECVKSIWEHTREYRYEVIVVDNGSQPNDFQVLSAFKGNYKLLRLDVNRFFGEGNNIGAELAKGEFLLFMNNDVIVTPNWLPPLMEVFRDHPDCGAAGPKFIYPNGLLQEAGALLDEEGGSVQIGKFQDPDSPRFNRGRVVDYVSAAAVLLRKKTFEDVLGFDFIYEPAYYEDVDLCLKIGQLGLKTFYVPESCVVHHENATTSDPKNGLQLNNIVAVNREKFVHRWNRYLKTGRHDGVIPTAAPLIREVQRDEGPATAAIFTPYNIIPGGGERYLLATAEALIQAGYQVWLVTPEKFSYLRIAKIAGILGLSLQALSITTLKAAEALPRFDVFVAMGNEIAPPVKAMGRANFYCCQFPFPCVPEEIDRRRGWMAQYDAIVVYSDFVKENVLRQLSRYSLPNVEIHIVHPPVDMLPFGTGNSRTNIISVGRFFTGGHCKQQDMLIRVFRRLYESGNKAELHFVGSLHPEPQHREYFIECQRLAQGLPVHFHADAPHETLASLYENASVYWHGAGFGVDTDAAPEKCEHFGISVVEAMSAGTIPLVVNNGGPAITVQHGWNGFCYDSEDGLIELTRKVLAQQEHMVAEMRGCARSRAMDFSKESFAVRWRALLH